MRDAFPPRVSSGRARRPAKSGGDYEPRTRLLAAFSPGERWHVGSAACGRRRPRWTICARSQRHRPRVLRSTVTCEVRVCGPRCHSGGRRYTLNIYRVYVYTQRCTVLSWRVQIYKLVLTHLLCARCPSPSFGAVFLITLPPVRQVPPRVIGASGAERARASANERAT